ncbi:MAG: prepilin-type N-terminal cleavage/methylation domain-containing protein [Acidobacteriota bacterium]
MLKIDVATPTRRSVRGFTLLEALIVLAIIGLMATLGLVAMREMIPRMRVDQAAKQFEIAFSQARLLAARESVPTALRLENGSIDEIESEDDLADDAEVSWPMRAPNNVQYWFVVRKRVVEADDTFGWQEEARHLVREPETSRVCAKVNLVDDGSEDDYFVQIDELAAVDDENLPAEIIIWKDIETDRQVVNIVRLRNRSGAPETVGPIVCTPASAEAVCIDLEGCP